MTSAPNRSLGVVASGKDRVVEIDIVSPVPGALLGGISIPGLVRIEGEREQAVRSDADLGDCHLILSPVTGGTVQAPVAAAPQLPRQNEVPPQLPGASLTGSMFGLPGVAGSRFKVKLVKKHSPAEFEPQTFSHGDVTLYAAPMPVGLHVDDPGGAQLFALAGPIRETARVDVTAALNRHLGATGVHGTSIAAVITVRSDVVGRASILWTTTGGVIERALKGRLSAESVGSPTEIVVPPPHPGREPIRTLADVTVSHHGMAIHPVSDQVPKADAGLGGVTVRDRAVVRALPPEALRDQVLRKVCVIGWPRGSTDLTLELLGVSASVEGLAPPVDRDPPLQVWFDLGEVAVSAPVEIRLFATRGGFHWIADPQPLMRLAIASGPEGERVSVGGRTIDLTGAETVSTAVALAGTDRWAVTTDQFCTVSIANAVMEFEP
ncbi:hypothetical protein [Humibacillus xanthopallidus]|uniref:hypothetical protein n=1 Tax=Humibacillus xanthopallidus TaxID=412689 RepID=UPI0011538DF6|nr:hypothetical protein [Humibacillus xanthopallidus]